MKQFLKTWWCLLTHTNHYGRYGKGKTTHLKGVTLFTEWMHCTKCQREWERTICVRRS